MKIGLSKRQSEIIKLAHPSLGWHKMRRKQWSAKADSIIGHPGELCDRGRSSGKHQAESRLPQVVFYGFLFSCTFKYCIPCLLHTAFVNFVSIFYTDF